mmetsp:Transcript_167033/g.536340  ORF Transcript_167033/g.536340 Transcript_167033/m.536340 type:complete len:244 (-) Transcript_167033:385-1116(-)
MARCTPSATCGCWRARVRSRSRRKSWPSRGTARCWNSRKPSCLSMFAAFSRRCCLARAIAPCRTCRFRCASASAPRSNSWCRTALAGVGARWRRSQSGASAIPQPPPPSARTAPSGTTRTKRSTARAVATSKCPTAIRCPRTWRSTRTTPATSRIRPITCKILAQRPRRKRARKSLKCRVRTASRDACLASCPRTSSRRCTAQKTRNSSRLCPSFAGCPCRRCLRAICRRRRHRPRRSTGVPP